MANFRNLVLEHISRSSLRILLVTAVVGLSVAGKSFYLTVDSTFDELHANVTSAIQLAAAYESRLKTVKESGEVFPPPNIEVPDRSLAKGERSKEVLLLQMFLKWKGHYPEDEKITGYFGEITFEALKKYQKDNHIYPEGIAGPLTREAWRRDIESTLSE